MTAVPRTCPACMQGDHDLHNYWWTHNRPADDGAYCPCEDGCVALLDPAAITGIEFAPGRCMLHGCEDLELCFGLCAVHVGKVFPVPHSGQGNWRRRGDVVSHATGSRLR